MNEAIKDIDTEKSVLTSFVLYQDERHEALTLTTANYFYLERHRLIFETINSLAAKGLEPDISTIAGVLQEAGNLKKAGGAAYLSGLIEENPPSINLKYNIKKLENLALKRALSDIGNVVFKLGRDPNSGTGLECLDKAMQMLIEISDSGADGGNAHISEAVRRVYEQTEQAYQDGGRIRGLKTGFYDYDRYTNGLNKGNLIIFAARPGEGKSAFAGNVGFNVAAEGHPVQFFSLEMTKEEIASRLLSAESKIRFSKLQRGDLDQAEWNRFADTASFFDELPLFVDDTAGLSNLDLFRRARKYKAQRNIELFIVDYMQLMHGQHPDNKVQDVSDISRTLKTMAKDLKVPVIALSQLNRDIEKRKDRRPKLSDLRDSGQLEQDADIVAFIYTLDEQKTIEIAKQRQGETGAIRVNWAADFVQFRNGTL